MTIIGINGGGGHPQISLPESFLAAFDSAKSVEPADVSRCKFRTAFTLAEVLITLGII